MSKENWIKVTKNGKPNKNDLLRIKNAENLKINKPKKLSKADKALKKIQTKQAIEAKSSDIEYQKLACALLKISAINNYNIKCFGGFVRQYVEARTNMYNVIITILCSRKCRESLFYIFPRDILLIIVKYVYYDFWNNSPWACQTINDLDLITSCDDFHHFVENDFIKILESIGFECESMKLGGISITKIKNRRDMFHSYQIHGLKNSRYLRIDINSVSEFTHVDLDVNGLYLVYDAELDEIVLGVHPKIAKLCSLNSIINNIKNKQFKVVAFAKEQPLECYKLSLDKFKIKIESRVRNMINRGWTQIV